MPQSKHVVFVAGEESGDQYAAEIIQELKASSPNLKISGIGGSHMEAQGVPLISDLARFGVTGIVEVIRHVRVIKKAFNEMKAHLAATKPDLLVLIDYPGFNLRLAQYAKNTLGLRILYYISPQVWAWKAGRIETIRKCVDHMAVILPFEKKIYEQAGVPVTYVGHPLVERINQYDRQNKIDLPQNKTLLAMLPGSRTNEILKHMPVLAETAGKLQTKINNLHIVIPVAETIQPELIEHYLKNKSFEYTLIRGHAIEVAAACDCVVSASGTASFECALLTKPMCIIYKVSLITYMLASKLIQVKYIGLCNLLQNQMTVPELLQYDCNATELCRTIDELLNDSDVRENMVNQLKKLKSTLSVQQADNTISQLILNEIGSSSPSQ